MYSQIENLKLRVVEHHTGEFTIEKYQEPRYSKNWRGKLILDWSGHWYPVGHSEAKWDDNEKRYKNEILKYPSKTEALEVLKKYREFPKYTEA